MRMSLKLFRIGRNLSQAKMAELLGYSRNHYARFESGEQDVTLRFLYALARKFDMSIDVAKELTTRDSERKTKNDR